MNPRSLYWDYFGVRTVDTAEVEQTLWNTRINSKSYAEPADKYQQAILERYKVYVEMTDRVSA